MISTEGLTGRIVLKDSPDYGEARQVYNARFQKFPEVIVYCSHPEDVVNAILWVRTQGIPLRVRDGGHSYEGFSLVNGGLIIDVSEMCDIQINNKQGTVRIGTGCRLINIYETLWQAGVTIPGGTCPTVGISGLTLGGGYGFLSRYMGMTCDSLIEVEMVTAHGKIIRANSGENTELFWACRGGGGGNFGVVTAFTFQTYPIGDVARCRMTWDFNALATVVDYWQHWAPHIDARLTSLLALPAPGQGDLRFTGIFVGTEEELRQITAPFQNAVPPKTIEIDTHTWIEAVILFAGTPVKQEWFKNSSAYVYEPLSTEALQTLTDNLKAAPGPINVLALDAYGGAIAQIPVDATAFFHRLPLFSMQYQSYWTQEAQETQAEQNINWIERFRTSMLPYTRGAYCNYCDRLILDWPTAYFGTNFPHLQTVKRMYDPENLFRFPQSIPPESL